jgi:phage FluMu protein Com
MILRIGISIETLEEASDCQSRAQDRECGLGFFVAEKTMRDLPEESEAEIRCQCGNLMARWYPDSIELKCKRCRRLVQIFLSDIQGAPPNTMQL